MISARPTLALAILVFVGDSIGCSRTGPTSGEPAATTVPANLVPLIDQALKAAHQNRLATHRHTPWELVHAGLGLGPDAPLWDHDAQQAITVGDYFRRGGPYLSEPIYVIQKDRISVRPSRHYSELERHPNQFLAYFAQMELPLDTELTVQGHVFTLADMVASAQKHFDPSAETTYSLLALTLYCPCEQRWQNVYGQTFSIENLVSLEMKADRQRLACGGTHSLFALGCALKKCADQRTPGNTLWDSVDGRLTEGRKATQAAQGIDWAFSAALVGMEESPGPSRDDLNAKIYSTGHTLEWLILTLDEEELKAPWVSHAIHFLCNAVIQRSIDPPPASSWYHALHALRMYRQRVSQTSRG